MYIYITYIYIIYIYYRYIYIYINLIMKTMSPPSYHQTGFVANSCTCIHDVTLHHVPNCMSCHKAIVVITRREHCSCCFHDYIYITGSWEPRGGEWAREACTPQKKLWLLFSFIIEDNEKKLKKLKF